MSTPTVKIKFKATGHIGEAPESAALKLWLLRQVDVVKAGDNFKWVMKHIEELKEPQIDVDVKRIVQQRNADLKVNYHMLRESFDEVKDLVFQVIVSLSDIDGKPVSYDTIITRAKQKHPDLKFQSVDRRIRELRAEGFIYEPVRGAFLLTSKEKVKTC